MKAEDARLGDSGFGRGSIRSEVCCESAGSIKEPDMSEEDVSVSSWLIRGRIVLLLRFMIANEYVLKLDSMA